MARKKRLDRGVVKMERVREVLRLAELGLTQREINRISGVSRAVIQEYLRKAWDIELTWETAKTLSDDELRARFDKRTPGRSRKTAGAAEPDFAALDREYYSRKGVTLELLWKEWIESVGEGYSYPTFCRRYREWAKHRKVILVREYPPGERSFVDYTGEKLSWWDDAGVEHPAEIFVAVLGASSLIFTEATDSQQLLSWIGSNTRALEFYGGVPQVVIIDNLKSGVIKADRYEPELTRTMEEWAAHYGTTVMPTRAKKPRDKGKVEQAVQDVERWVLAPLRKRRFHSLAEMNEAMKPLLQALNDRQMQEYGASRRERYESSDCHALRPLPPQAYVPATWKLARVNLDYHVELDRHYYSVPFTLSGEQVWVKRTEKLVEILHRNVKVASHAYSSAPFRFSTLPDHMPEHHRVVRSWTAELFTEWAHKIGPETERLVGALLATPRFREQSFRSILGLQRLEKKYGAERLEQAAAHANKRKVVSQRFVRLLLEGGKDSWNSPLTHGNLRGPGYFH